MISFFAFGNKHTRNALDNRMGPPCWILSLPPLPWVKANLLSAAGVVFSFAWCAALCRVWLFRVSGRRVAPLGLLTLGVLIALIGGFLQLVSIVCALGAIFFCCLNFCGGRVWHPGEFGGPVTLPFWRTLSLALHSSALSGISWVGLDVRSRSHCTHPTERLPVRRILKERFLGKGAMRLTLCEASTQGQH